MRQGRLAALAIAAAITAGIAISTGRFAFHASESPLLLAHPRLGPALLLVLGASLIVTATWRGGRIARRAGLLLPLLLTGGILVNTWWLPPHLLRVPDPGLAALFQQPQDAFGNMAVYVRLAERFGGMRMAVPAETLTSLELLPWELEAYGRLSAVEPATIAPLTDAEAERLLRYPHDTLRVQALGFADGRYYSYFREYVLIGGADNAGALTVAVHGTRAVVMPMTLLIEARER